MVIQILVMCGKIVPRVLLIISYSKRVFYSSMFFTKNNYSISS